MSPISTAICAASDQNRNCHGAIRKLNDMIEGHKTNYILDADIKGFFDNLNHDWIMKFISSRITDNSVLRLVEKDAQSRYS